MNIKSLKILEYGKIIQILSSFATSAPGKKLAEKIVPLSSIEKINELLCETEDAVYIILKKGQVPLGGIREIRHHLKRIDMGGILNPGDLLQISDVLRACRNLKNYIKDRIFEQQSNRVIDIINSLKTSKPVEDKINSCIESEDRLFDNASPELMRIRRKVQEIQNSIKGKLESIIRSSELKSALQDSIVTMRNDRYVIPVKQGSKGRVQGLVHDTSSTGATLFIEPLEVVEANNKIRQLKNDEKKEIEKILAELTALAAEIYNELTDNAFILPKLDFIFAKAKLALHQKAVKPEINDKNIIDIKGARHPLINSDIVVPIDIKAGEDFNTLIITGPNTGGKTVALKTMGLLVLMMQAGLFVPAKSGSKIAFFKQVFCDIGDEQSIEQSLSTFSSHMTNIVYILKKADRRSLVLLDELGAGTDPAEGAALAMAILETFHKRKGITIATTHYSELKLYALKRKGVRNACCEFNVETLKPTYRLIIGTPGKSNAFAISKRLGLQEHILKKAEKNLEEDNIKFEDVLLDIERNRTELEQEKNNAVKLRREIEDIKSNTEKERELIEKTREREMKKAREEAKDILARAKEEAADIVKELKEIKNGTNPLKSRVHIDELNSQLKNSLNDIKNALSDNTLLKKGNAKPPKNLIEGEDVYIINLGREGIVINPVDKNDEVMVQVGAMKINVHVSNLKRINKKEKQHGYTMTRPNDSMKTVKTEIDIRGDNIIDAAEKVDKFLDEAVMAGFAEVTIIHGKGTGALRKGIWEHLKKHSAIKSFRKGKFGEGEDGVTIISI